MKTQYKLLFAAVICFGLFSVSMFTTQRFQSTKGEASNVTFAEDLTIELQKKPMKIIQLQQPSREELFRHRVLVAKQLPMAKKDPSIHFTVDEKRGLVSFNRGMEKYNGAFRPQLPRPSEAQQLAMKFLEESKLMPKEREQLKLIHNGGLRAAYVEGGKKSVTVDKLRTLTFGRAIDGIPVTGEGSKIVINIGDRGDVVSVIHKWKNSIKSQIVSPSQMKSESRAKAEIQELIAKEFTSKAEITAIQQIYYNGNGQFIQPVYAFEALIYDKIDTEPIAYVGVIPALNKVPEAVDLNRRMSKGAQEYIKKGSTKQPPVQDTKQD